MMKPKFTPEEFKQLVIDYLAERKANGEIPTIMHFAMHIGISREQLYKYYKVQDGYREAYEVLETHRDGMTEFAALNPSPDDNRNSGLMIFALKNIGWTDRQELQHTGANGGAIENKWTVEFVNAEAKDK
jgi:hypothetical protein